jgi:DNA-damage-inducible protein J
VFTKGVEAMAATAFVRARIDEKTRDEAAAVLAELGLTVSDVVRMTLTRVAKDKALPLDLKVPNAETRAAMAESRAMMKTGKPGFATADSLFESLDKNLK